MGGRPRQGNAGAEVCSAGYSSPFLAPGPFNQSCRISEIRDGKKHDDVKPALQEELDAFLKAWPNINERTGLQRHEDELLVKAREAMIAAVHIFNSAGLHFRAELFIVTSIIAWTYLLHAYYKREGIDYRYKQSDVVVKTPEGADKYWGLSHCLKGEKRPLEKGVRNNLNVLLSLRHEIEHRSTSRIDDALGAKLQACCINFNDTLKRLFGKRLTLEKSLPIALQFATFDGRQGKSLLGADLPRHIKTAVDKVHEDLTENEWNDPRFAYRVAFVPKLSGNPSTADQAVEFVKPGSPKAIESEHVVFKETERPKFLPGEIVKKVQDAGYPDFKMHDHTLL